MEAQQLETVLDAVVSRYEKKITRLELEVQQLKDRLNTERTNVDDLKQRVKKQKSTTGPLCGDPSHSESPYIAKEQRDEIQSLLRGESDLAKEILQQFNIDELDQLPKVEYSAIANRVRRVKQLKEGK